MKRLYRTQSDRMISGVCGGVAAYFGLDPSLVRISLVVIAFMTAIFPTVVCYFIATLIIPNEQDILE